MSDPVSKTTELPRSGYYEGDYRGAFTDFGFKWGPAEIIRATSDPKHGVWLIIRADKEEVTIRVTRSGLLRVGNVERNTT